MGTATIRKLAQRTPAFKPEEIAQRLFTIAARLESMSEKGKVVTVEDLRYLASKIRRYARRLQTTPGSEPPPKPKKPGTSTRSRTHHRLRPLPDPSAGDKVARNPYDTIVADKKTFDWE